MKVRDIMTKNVVAVREAASIEDVARLIANRRFHGVPVIDSGKNLVGIITESNFFSKENPLVYFPSYIKFLGIMNVGKSITKQQCADIKNILKASAKDIMTEKCVTVAPETAISELVSLVTRKGFYTIPVVSAGNKLAGVVTGWDIIKNVNKITKKYENKK